MKFKLVTMLWLAPNLSPEKQEEIAKALNRHASGALQAMKGNLRQQISEDFLAMFSPERVKQMEESIKHLHSIGGYKKFRAECLGLLFDAFLGGILSDDKSKEEFEKILKKYGMKIEIT